tara:strand:+ start:1708 stop:2199 length:492 start_codon:yes stop_codon:yes gene_type:complete
MIELIIIGILLIFLNGLSLIFMVRKSNAMVSSSYETLLSEINSKLYRLEEDKIQNSSKLEALPSRVLRTFQGSVNTTTGRLGELVKFIELQRLYDRLIPVGNVVDFIGISFPDKEHPEDYPGTIDFIDVKTGKRAALSKDQKLLRKLVEDKLISFSVVKVEVE